jgi:copper homeostasis protein
MMSRFRGGSWIIHDLGNTAVSQESNIKIEICINSDAHLEQSVRAAYEGGADTVELCSQMALQGLTPTAEQIALARAAFAERRGLMVMIRLRAGDFCYTRAEVELMLREVDTAVSHGANGVVFGAVRDNKLDLPALRRLVSAAQQHGVAVTCHRAFDAVSNPTEALETLIDCGVDRVLTSGTPWGSWLSAADGVPQLIRLIEQADKRIEVVLGGGIHRGNVRAILAQLPAAEARLSVHVYTAVLHDGVTDLELVKRLVGVVKG